MGSFKKHFTLEAANNGLRMTIVGPDGKDTKDALIVRGQDSEAYQTGQRLFRRDIIQYREENGPESVKTDAYSKFIDEAALRMKSTLVVGWTFDEKCIPANVLELLKNSPFVAEQIETFAAKRERFAGNSQTTSEPSPKTKSV